MCLLGLGHTAGKYTETKLHGCFSDVVLAVLLLLTRGSTKRISRGRSRIFACVRLAGRCHWSAGFLGDLPFLTLLHPDTAPYSPRFTRISSQDLDVKTGQNLSLRKTLNFLALLLFNFSTGRISEEPKPFVADGRATRRGRISDAERQCEETDVSHVRHGTTGGIPRMTRLGIETPWWEPGELSITQLQTRYAGLEPGTSPLSAAFITSTIHVSSNSYRLRLTATLITSHVSRIRHNDFENPGFWCSAKCRVSLGSLYSTKGAVWRLIAQQQFAKMLYAPTYFRYQTPRIGHFSEMYYCRAGGQAAVVWLKLWELAISIEPVLQIVATPADLRPSRPVGARRTTKADRLVFSLVARGKTTPDEKFQGTAEWDRFCREGNQGTGREGGKRSEVIGAVAFTSQQDSSYPTSSRRSRRGDPGTYSAYISKSPCHLGCPAGKRGAACCLVYLISVWLQGISSFSFFLPRRRFAPPGACSLLTCAASNGVLIFLFVRLRGFPSKNN
ncbi:hypothetical protein PR048_027718 [Dryococelus australis]|uniref:Uncharacterized protein n=1 Tax=Dryococelus australis TaxID=614101 RepID=A0ABQ9GH90_9NEOP|nr:hypothetical protein PR048_027718 [Dryococelus australis]